MTSNNKPELNEIDVWVRISILESKIQDNERRFERFDSSILEIASVNYNEKCIAAREWVTSDESMMSARWMSKNIIDGIDETFTTWVPRKRYDLIKVETPEQPKHYVKYPIAQ